MRDGFLKPAPKHALEVNVWPGISKRGIANICIFDEIMDGALYMRILQDFLLHFLTEYFPDEYYRFM